MSTVNEEIINIEVFLKDIFNSVIWPCEFIYNQ